MNKTIASFLTILFAIHSTRAQCQPDEFENPLAPGLCFFSTGNPIFTFCPPLDIPIPTPNYCGIMNDDTLRNFTTPC